MFDGVIHSITPLPAGLRIVPLTPALHRFAAIAERDPLQAEHCEQEPICQLHCNQWGMALLGRGQVLACGGLIPLWAGHAEAWLMVSRHATARDLVPGLRFAREVLDRRQRDPFFRRISMRVREDAPWRRSFAHALGFRAEAYLAAWGPGSVDYHQYSRVAG